MMAIAARIGFLAALMLVIASPAIARQPPPITAMTFNVRLSGVDDGPNSWRFRRDLAARTIRDAGADVIGTQELMRDQADDLLARLPGHAWFGIDRRGGRADEHMGIFYRHDRLRLIDIGHYWLSDTPAVPGSISWGHPYPRMVSWGLFETIAGGRRFLVANTHLPYRAEDEPARTRGAALIRERLAALDPTLPVILLGDFNSEPDGPAHAVLTGSLSDSWESARVRSGPSGTFHGFSGTGERRIDWILARGFVARAVRTVVRSARGRYPSDHHPVIATLDWSID